MTIRTLLMIAAFVSSFAVLSVNADEAQDMKDFKAAYAEYNKKIDSGDLKGSLIHAQRAYEFGVKLFEPDSQNLLALADNYAFNLESLGKTKEAEKVYLSLISDNEKFYGRYAESLIPMLEGVSKIVSKSDKEASKAYAVRALKLNMRHNSMEMSQKIPEGKIKKSKTVSKLKKNAGKVTKRKFKELESEHWVVIYSEGHEEGAQLLSAQAELAYKNVRSFLLALNFAQKPIKKKLVAVLFGSQEEYLQYLEAKDYSTRSAGAYYHEADALLMYDEIHKRSKWEYFKRTNVVAAETTQYVTVRAKLMNKENRIYPRWLYDGLASSFEFNDIDQDFGPHTPNVSARNWEFVQELIDDEDWKSLEEFVRLTPAEESDRANKRLVYYTGTFLVRFLYANYSDEFLKYLEMLPQTMNPKSQTRNDRLKVFKKAFGEPKNLESEWRRFLQSFGITFPDY